MISYTNQGLHCLPSKNTHWSSKYKLIRLSKQGLLFISRLSCLSLSHSLSLLSSVSLTSLATYALCFQWHMFKLRVWGAYILEIIRQTPVAQQRNSPVWRRSQFMGNMSYIAVLLRACEQGVFGVLVLLYHHSQLTVVTFFFGA